VTVPDHPHHPRASGLRNPAAAVRGVGAGALAVEAMVLLLAVAPLAKLGGAGATTAIWLVAALTATALVLAALLRHPWAWWAALAIPFGLLGGGLLHWSLAALGIVFGLLWAYLLTVRRTVLATPAEPTGGFATPAEPTDGFPTG
jgi:hypothetical protein